MYLRIARLLAAASFLSLCLGQTPQLSPSSPITKMTLDASGNVYVAQGTSISKLNPAMTSVQWTTELPFAVLTMNLTTSGTIATAGLLSLDGLVVQIDPVSGNILSGTLFTIPAGMTTQAIAITAAGNIVLSGVSPMPASQGAINIPVLSASLSQIGSLALMKLDPAGHLLWTAQGIGGPVVTTDSAENIYVAGATFYLSNFPTTANAFQRTATDEACQDSMGSAASILQCPDQWVAKVSADGTRILFGTYLTGLLGAYPYDIALGADGSVYTVGTVQATDYPVTPGAIVQTNPAKFVNALDVNRRKDYPYSGFLSRLSPDGSSLLYSTYLGGSQWDYARTVAVGNDGRIVVGGVAVSPDFPGLPPQLDDCRPGSSLLMTKQRDFLLQISADGSQINSGQLIGGTNPGPGISCIVDAADTSFADAVSQGELITINGFGVGPEASTVASIASPAMQLGGVSVMFDGFPALLTAAGGTIVTAIVPIGIGAQQFTTLTLLHDGQPFDSRQLSLAGTSSMFVLPPNPKACDAPPAWEDGSFIGGSPTPVPMILNSDGTLNACDNPASLGSVITLFTNGASPSGYQLSVFGSVIIYELPIPLSLVSVTPVGSVYTDVAAVRIQLPATSANPIYLEVAPQGKPLTDYMANSETNGGIPVYVK
jgi:uncharacterized protein (TIGR03437 family)